MTLRIPSREAMQHLACTIGLTLSEAETDAYAALIAGVVVADETTGDLGTDAKPARNRFIHKTLVQRGRELQRFRVLESVHLMWTRLEYAKTRVQFGNPDYR